MCYVLLMRATSMGAREYIRATRIYANRLSTCACEFHIATPGADIAYDVNVYAGKIFCTTRSYSSSRYVIRVA